MTFFNQIHRRLPVPGATALSIAVVFVAGLSACGASNPTAESTGRSQLRLGYFPNLTHAPALIGVDGGIFQRSLGSQTKLVPRTFKAGPEAVEAIFSDGLDAAFVGPNPAINAYSRSKGAAIRIVAGATQGGSFLIVSKKIHVASDLRGKQLATPQLGGTQDVALRTWLGSKKLKTTLLGGGDVAVVPQENAQALTSFRSGLVDGAWVPEPWATRMIAEGGGHVLVDERELWPAGKYPTTQLIVRTQYLRAHPDVIRRLVAGHLEVIRYLNRKPAEAQVAVNKSLQKLLGKGLEPAVLRRSWSKLTFSYDPVSSSIVKSAADAHALGLLPKVDLGGIYDIAILNALLSEQGRKPVGVS